MRRDRIPTSRREVLTGALAASGGLIARGALAGAPAAGFREIEARTGGRLGLWAARDGSAPVAWRADERFLMCSTFKFLAVAAVLALVDKGVERLDRRIAYGQSDLLDYAPVTKAHVGQGGMGMGDLCAAAIELSDHTAANLILASLGGPKGVTGYVRSLGDAVTRLDRIEPELNQAQPGDPRDSTTPASMAGLWRKILVGGALSTASRERMMDWLAACQTGAARLPTVTPPGWRIGHKTGSGRTTIGDIAMLSPPTGAPVLIAVYFECAGVPDARRDSAIADAGRLALKLLKV